MPAVRKGERWFCVSTRRARRWAYSIANTRITNRSIENREESIYGLLDLVSLVHERPEMLADIAREVQEFHAEPPATLSYISDEDGA